MKWLFVVLFSLLLSPVNGQSGKIDCRILQQAIEADVFENRFFVCQGKDTINIVDTTESFNNCTLNDVCNRKFSLHHDNSKIKKENLIEIYRISQIKNIFTLQFHRPFTGAALTLKIKLKKDIVKVVGYEIGAF